jgi:hypothetical protein
MMFLCLRLENDVRNSGQHNDQIKYWTQQETWTTQPLNQQINENLVAANMYFGSRYNDQSQFIDFDCTHNDKRPSPLVRFAYARSVLLQNMNHHDL